MHLCKWLVGKAMGLHDVHKAIRAAGQNGGNIELLLIINDEIDGTQLADLFRAALGKATRNHNLCKGIGCLFVQGLANQVAAFIVSTICNRAGIDDVDIRKFLPVNHFGIIKLRQ